jgi:hypothetical protein
MKIEIIDFDCLSDDREGRNLFVLFSKHKIAFAFNTAAKAELWVSKTNSSFPCEVYQPRPNGFLDTPHVHMRADSQFRLKDLIAVGDIITIL